MIKKNENYTGDVVDIGAGGEGIIKAEGATVFVPFCLTGEKVKFKILKCKDNIAYGKLSEVITPSEERALPPCPVFGKCGGCDLQHMNYPAQLAFKRESVNATLMKIGGVYCDVNETVPCSREYGYRNKLVLPVSIEGGVAETGFYARHSHRIVPVRSCAIQADWADKVFSAVQSAAPYLPDGAVRHIAVREIKGKFIFALVVRRECDASPLIKQLEKNFKDFTFLLNINPDETNVIFGNKWRALRGSGFYSAEDCGIKYRAGANTFLQVNDDVRSKLYAAVLAEAEEDAVIIDLYSGGGMLTAMLAKKCAAAYGIEVVEEASRCADELRDANGLQGKMFNVCGKAEDKLDEVLAATEGRRRIIVCDPPRKGMERSVVKAVAASGAAKVILISCNPATLARDCGLLCGTLEDVNGALFKMGNDNGAYKITSVTPFDMFPQTKWCETLVVLSHKKPDGHINIKVEFGEEEGQVSLKEVAKRAEERKPKEKVTYKKMQDYIEQTYGFKVHTAYIAEVKRDLGLPMYDAPNAVEELKHPRPHPTPKMVEAIKETLKHFEILYN